MDTKVYEETFGEDHWWTYKRVEIHYDEEPPHPREDQDNLGTIVAFHSRYQFDENPKQSVGDWLLGMLYGQRLEEYDEATGDYTDDWYEFAWALRGIRTTVMSRADAIGKALDLLANKVLMLPVYLLDHSGLRISTSSSGFHAVDAVGWDWGQLGWIYITWEDAQTEWGFEGDGFLDNEEATEKITKLLKGEIKELDDYFMGNYYGFVIYDWGGNPVDSCWGFGGYDPEQLAKDAANGSV